MTPENQFAGGQSGSGHNLKSSNELDLRLCPSITLATVVFSFLKMTSDLKIVSKSRLSSFVWELPLGIPAGMSVVL